MGTVVDFPGVRANLTTDEYFGGCPHCGGCDQYMNVERDHWCVCHKHKTKWWIGSNLFSAWKREGEDLWRRNEYRLANYMEVKPIRPEPTEEERRWREECKAHEEHMRRLGEMPDVHGSEVLAGADATD